MIVIFSLYVSVLVFSFSSILSIILFDVYVVCSIFVHECMVYVLTCQNTTNKEVYIYLQLPKET